MCWIFHGVQVIEVPEEFIEAVNGGQKFIEIAQVVLAELTGSVALRFERSSNGASLRRDASLRTSLADCRHSRADGQLAHDEVRSTRCTAGLSVVVGEQYAFLGHLVEIRRSSRH